MIVLQRGCSLDHNHDAFCYQLFYAGSKIADAHIILAPNRNAGSYTLNVVYQRTNKPTFYAHGVFRTIESLVRHLTRLLDIPVESTLPAVLDIHPDDLTEFLVYARRELKLDDTTKTTIQASGLKSLTPVQQSSIVTLRALNLKTLLREADKTSIADYRKLL